MSVAIAVLVLLAAPAVRAEDSPYCEKVQARAASEAALLMSPQLSLQAIRFPSDGQLDTATTGTQTQLRGALSFSPVDFYRGVRVLRLGGADCAQHAPGEALETVLSRAAEGARLSALHAQIAFLEEHSSEWRGLAGKAEERLITRVVTLVDLNPLRLQVDALERKLIDAVGDAKRLEARFRDTPLVSASALAEAYLDRAVRFEEEGSRIRKLDAWDLRLTGGVVPRGREAEWFGVAEITFKPGWLFRNRQEDRYLAARADELRTARYEMNARLGRLREETRAAREQARRDLELLDKQLVTVSRTRRLLQLSESPNALHARDALRLDEISVEADKVYLQGLIDALANTGE